MSMTTITAGLENRLTHAIARRLGGAGEGTIGESGDGVSFTFAKDERRCR